MKSFEKLAQTPLTISTHGESMSKKRFKKTAPKITAQQLLLNDLHGVIRLKLMPEESDKIQSLILAFMRYSGWTDRQEWLVKILIEKSIKAELATGGATKSKRRMLADRAEEINAQDADMEVLAEARKYI